MTAPGTRHVHAEHVGSLLRPAYLLDARARHRAGELPDDALREVLDRALSPQCGFASTKRGNLLTVDEEKRRLELVATTAQKVWG